MNFVQLAKWEANRRNALLSRGPKTEAGKERSRRNAYKHGMTGEGVVLSPEDAEAVETRYAALVDEVGFEAEATRLLARRMAVVSVRMDRAARQEEANIQARVEGAEAAFLDKRLAEAEHLMETLTEHPITNSRRLKMTPEGLDRLIAEWERLRYDAMTTPETRWTGGHALKADYLNGSPSDHIAPSPYRNWSLGVDGYYKDLAPEHFKGMKTDDEKREFCLRKVIELIDADLTRYRELRATMDTSPSEAQRANAAEIALFDPSREAVLARKYDAANERAFFRCLKELKEIRQSPKPSADAELPRANVGLGSFFSETPPPPEPQPEPPSEPPTDAILPTNEVAISVGKIPNRRE